VRKDDSGEVKILAYTSCISDKHHHAQQVTRPKDCSGVGLVSIRSHSGLH